MNKQSECPVAKAVLRAARQLLRLSPGPLSELRRMTEDAVAPEFWRLAAQHKDTIGNRTQRCQWIAIVRILAILTEKGDPAKRSPLHDHRRRLGAVLCDGGEQSWPKPGGTPRPAFSERRLAQLIAARGRQQAVLLERAARILARSRAPGNGVNVVDLAYTLLKPKRQCHLAEYYYRRLDNAERTAQQESKGEIE